MIRTPVESSNIASIGYDAVQRLLEVEFKHGGVYQYLDVSFEHYDGLMAADSKGKYLSLIKENYMHRKLDAAI